MTKLRSAVGRAELVRAYSLRGRDALAEMAQLLGFEKQFEPFFQRPVVKGIAALRPAAEVTETPVEIHGEKLNFQPIPFLRVVSVEYNDKKERVPKAPVPKVDLDPQRERSQPQSPPLVAWPRLWRVLEDFFRSRQESERVDAARLVDAMARGTVIRRLPRKWLPVAGQVRLVLDRSRHLVPFWSDQLALAAELLRRLGPHRLRVEFLGPQGPSELALSGTGEEEMVVVTDLAFLAEKPAEMRPAWRRAGDRLEREGGRVRALVPCPSNRWEPGLAELWNAVEWETPNPGVPASRRIEESELAERRDTLLRLVAPAIRVEPGLLRELRLLLGNKADAGTEADVWRLFPNPSSVAATPPAEVQGWRKRLRDEGFSSEIERGLVKALRRWHGTLPPLVLAEELATHTPSDSLEESERKEQADLLRAACEQIEAHGRAGASQIAAWFDRWNWRMPEAPADSDLVASLLAAWKVLLAEDDMQPLPPWTDPELLAAVQAEGEERSFEIRQVGGDIRLRPPGSPLEGSPLGELRGSSNRIQIRFSSSGEYKTEGIFPLELSAGGARFELGSLPSGFRLFSDLEAIELASEIRPPWASAAGRDRYGLWADLEIGGVVQRLRYIRPGRFLMGSSESERGRWETEGPQHTVVLTEGFWLADTPCIQALWGVVMGDSPSYFKGAHRPVERISSDDVDLFLKALQERLGGEIEARLPSEAQWEYSCRAGTVTNTYAGELHIGADNKAYLLDEIAWYAGNTSHLGDMKYGEVIFKRPRITWQRHDYGTQEVAGKSPNGWGLYDTLGNVWEWCADYWEGNYQPGKQRDPIGPKLGSSRVIRGGSWRHVAWFVRATCRLQSPRNNRKIDLGFRFLIAS